MALPNQDLELLRKDLRSMKKQLVAANIQLTDTEAEKFWPIYDQYALEVRKLYDARYAIIKTTLMPLAHSAMLRPKVWPSELAKMTLLLFNSA